MEIEEITDIKSYIFNSKFIGKGTTAACFLLKDNLVLKYYINTYRKKDLFKIYNMKEQLESIYPMNNNTLIGPEKLLIKDNELVGYIYKYVKGKDLNKYIKNNVKLYDLFNNYNKMLEDIKMASYYNFHIGDLHSRNIIFNDNYYIIDLDQSYFMERYIDNCLTINMVNIRNAIFQEIFNIKYNQILEFKDNNLNKAYYKLKWDNIDDVYYFLSMLSNNVYSDNPNIKELRKIKLIKY